MTEPTPMFLTVAERHMLIDVWESFLNHCHWPQEDTEQACEVFNKLQRADAITLWNGLPEPPGPFTVQLPYADQL